MLTANLWVFGKVSRLAFGLYLARDIRTSGIRKLPPTADFVSNSHLLVSNNTVLREMREKMRKIGISLIRQRKFAILIISR